SLYEPYMFEHVPKPYIKFVDDDIELVINNINDDLNLISDQVSKSRRRARIMELGYLLIKKSIGLDFNIEDITFTSSLKLIDEISDKENEHPSNLYTEDNETSPVTTKSTDFFNNGYICDHNKSDDEGIMELKSRKQELENLLAATREGLDVPQHKNFRQIFQEKYLSCNEKGDTTFAFWNCYRICYNCDRYQLTYRGSQHGQKNHP
ncbi:7288_t:CDS:2, partial [Cetraspora pellucida]